MTILEKISQQVIEEYKTGNQEKRVTLQTLRSALLNKEKELKGLDDTAAVKVLQSENKQRKEALEQYRNSGRDDLVEKIAKEISIIEQYLPSQMSEAEIEAIVKEEIEKAPQKEFGPIMKAAMTRLQGSADGKIIAEIVKKNI